MNEATRYRVDIRLGFVAIIDRQVYRDMYGDRPMGPGVTEVDSWVAASWGLGDRPGDFRSVRTAAQSLCSRLESAETPALEEARRIREGTLARHLGGHDIEWHDGEGRFRARHCYICHDPGGYWWPTGLDVRLCQSCKDAGS